MRQGRRPIASPTPRERSRLPGRRAAAVPPCSPREQPLRCHCFQPPASAPERLSLPLPAHASFPSPMPQHSAPPRHPCRRRPCRPAGWPRALLGPACLQPWPARTGWLTTCGTRGWSSTARVSGWAAGSSSGAGAGARAAEGSSAALAAACPTSRPSPHARPPAVEAALRQVDRARYVDASIPRAYVYQAGRLGAHRRWRRARGSPGAASSTRNRQHSSPVWRRHLHPPSATCQLRSLALPTMPPPARARRRPQDAPLPIGYHETISAPHMHATCLELLRDHLRPGARVLDVGSGALRSRVPGVLRRRGVLPCERCRGTSGTCQRLTSPALAALPAATGSGYLSTAMGLMVGDTGVQAATAPLWSCRSRPAGPWQQPLCSYCCPRQSRLSDCQCRCRSCAPRKQGDWHREAPRAG